MKPNQLLGLLMSKAGSMVSTYPRTSFFVGLGVCTITFFRIQSRISRYSKFVDMTGKTVIITGANTGIGLETAKAIAKFGAKVIMACRDVGKGQKAADEVISCSNNCNVVVKKLDLCSFASVREFADDIIKNEPKVDVLINNAGILGSRTRQYSVDGLETIMQTNHLGPFLLTKLLIDKLKASAPSRIVNVSSGVYSYQTLDLTNMNSEGPFDHTKVYNNTKFANVLFTLELAKWLRGTGVTANCLHPGIIDTGLARNTTLPLYCLIKIICFIFGKTRSLGAETSVFVAVDPDLKTTSGKYYDDCYECPYFECARDERLARDLWIVSEAMIEAAEDERALA